MKRFEILTILETVNYRNQHSTCPADVRQGWNSLLEDILHRANVYAGYNYLVQKEVPRGEKPGMVIKADGSPLFLDETRRYYIIHNKLERIAK